jgi:predicted transcriptional regulator
MAVKSGPKRASQDIIIEILELLRESPDGLIQTDVTYMANLASPQTRMFLKYLVNSGLIEPTEHRKPVQLTEQGRTIPLDPREFLDYEHESGKRSRYQIQEDIFKAIHLNGDRTGITAIVNGTNVIHPTAVRYLEELVGSGEILKTPEGKYSLTDFGRSRLDPDWISENPTMETPNEMDGYKRAPQDIIIEMLGYLRESEDGIFKYPLLGRIGLISTQMKGYEEYLVNKGLIEPVEKGKPVQLTEQGKTIPLDPRRFLDYEQEGGRRSRYQIQEDIFKAVHLHGGEASIATILGNSGLSHSKIVRYLEELVGSGEILKTPESKYRLTDFGRSRLDSDLISENPTMETPNEMDGYKRAPQDIIIEMLGYLRESEDGLIEYQLQGKIGLVSTQMKGYEKYLVEKGLIEPIEKRKPIQLTEKGRIVPIDPREFLDYEQEGGRRSRYLIHEDIVSIALQHNNEFGITAIVLEAGLVHPQAGGYLEDLIGLGMMSRSEQGRFSLTEKGLARYAVQKI